MCEPHAVDEERALKWIHNFRQGLYDKAMSVGGSLSGSSTVRLQKANRRKRRLEVQLSTRVEDVAVLPHGIGGVASRMRRQRQGGKQLVQPEHPKPPPLPTTTASWTAALQPTPVLPARKAHIVKILNRLREEHPKWNRLSLEVLQSEVLESRPRPAFFRDELEAIVQVLENENMIMYRDLEVHFI